jgi:hypothetical protein
MQATNKPPSVPFARFIGSLNLSEVEIARHAHLRPLIVWRMSHGLPVKREHANRVVVAIWNEKHRFFRDQVATFIEREKDR